MYERYVLETFEYCGIKSFPVNCATIAERIGYRIVSYQEVAKTKKDLINMIQISGDAYVVRKDKTIYVNSDVQSLQRIRFSIAHELGHVILLTDDEDVANDFASNLLAPRPIVFAKGLKTAEEISCVFDISISAANNTMKDMRKHGFYAPSEKGRALIEHFGLPYPTIESAWRKVVTM